MDTRLWLGGIACALMVTATGAGAAGGRFAAAPDLVLPRLETLVSGGIELHFVSNDQVLMSGAFTWVNDVAHAGLVRLHADGVVDDSYHAEVAPSTTYFGGRSLAVQSDGTTYLIVEQSSGARDRLWRLRPDGSRDPGFELVAGWAAPPPEFGAGYLGTIAPGRDGRMLVWGSFDLLGGIATPDVGLVNADGTVNDMFAWQLPLSLHYALPLADGRWIVIGQLDTGVPVPGGGESTIPVDLPRLAVARVLADGSLDPTFHVSVVASSYFAGPHAFALDDEERVIFAEPGPLSSRHSLQLVRLLADGTRDTSYAPILPEIVDPLLPYATAGAWSETTEPGVGDDRLVYIPPMVDRIVAADDGVVLCFAKWQDPALRGVLGVAADGTFDADLVSYAGPGSVHWLRRDPAGTWWGDFATLTADEPTAGPARLRNDGTIDPEFRAKATAAGYAYQVAALPDGAVAVQGDFDFAGGVPGPGLVILESNGAVRDVRAPHALQRNRVGIAAVLADGSLLVQPGPPLAYVLRSARPMVYDAVAAGPAFGRWFADGSWQSLMPAVPGYYQVANGWLDAAGRVVVHVPGLSTAGNESFASDLLRFSAAGAHDTAYRARDQSGTPVTLNAASLRDDGRGAWALTWIGQRQQLLELDESGQMTRAIPLWSNTTSPYLWSAYTVAGVAGGAVLGGSFHEFNETGSPGLAFVRDGGALDDTWGGWLRRDSVVYAARRLENGLILIVGGLQTPLGERSALVLTPEGLPLPVQPDFSGTNFSASPWFVSPAGDWIARLATNESGTTGRVARWQISTGPEIHVMPSINSIRIGDELSLGVDWSGVPAQGVTWYRDGVALNPQPGIPFSFVVRAEDDGTVFWAFVQFEDGGGSFTLPWPLVVSGPWARMTNASIRAVAGAEAEPLILGTVLGGSGSGRILTRALGPALGDLGLGEHAGALGSTLVRPGGFIVAPPEDFRIARDLLLVSHPDVVAAAQAVGALLAMLGPLSGNDQMIYEDLAAGPYHFHVSPHVMADDGIVLAELFTLNQGGPARRGLWVRNFSGRAVLQSGAGVLIGGFVIEGDRPLRVLLRGVGPGLSGYGLSNTAANPVLELHAGSTVLGGNDDWSATAANRAAVEAAQSATGAFALAVDSRDAAAVFDLLPGIYTVVVRSDDPADLGRVALLEIYALE